MERAGVGVFVVADSVSCRSDRREAAHHRARRRGAARARVPRVPRQAPTRGRADRAGARRNGARARPRDRRRDCPRAQGRRVPLRQPRSAGLPHRELERRVVAAARVTNTIGGRAFQTSPRRSVEGGRSVESVAVSVLLALVFLAFHLRYLPQSLEDLDSINFALGVRHFDVAQHQPHPPGYPLYILIAKAVHLAVPSEAATLSIVSLVAGAIGIFAMARLMRAVDDA